MYSCKNTAYAVGSPIRIFTDQRLFASPRDFSQRTTSFFASQCQGIHQMPFLRLFLKVRIQMILHLNPVSQCYYVILFYITSQKVFASHNNLFYSIIIRCYWIFLRFTIYIELLTYARFKKIFSIWIILPQTIFLNLT